MEKINDIYKTWLRWYDYNKEIVVAYAMIAGITLIVGTVGFVIGALVYCPTGGCEPMVDGARLREA